MKFTKAQRNNAILFVIILLITIPATRKPIQVFMTRLWAGTPDMVSIENQKVIEQKDWTLEDLYGQPFKVDIYRTAQSRGNAYTFVSFWATWCPPCIAELPSMQAMYERYGNSISFYFVSNEDPETLKKFMKKKGYTFPVYIGKSTPPAPLNYNNIPHNYLIGPDNKIIIDEVGASDWDSRGIHSQLDALIAQ